MAPSTPTQESPRTDADLADHPTTDTSSTGPATPPAPARRIPRMTSGGARSLGASILLPLIPIVAFVVIWHYLTVNEVVAWLRFNRMPTPAAVLESFTERLGSGAYYDDLFASLQRILLGFLLAALVGIAMGMLIGRSEVARKTLRPFIEMVRPIPAIALVPLTILLFPSSEQGIVFITFFAAFFPVLVKAPSTPWTRCRRSGRKPPARWAPDDGPSCAMSFCRARCRESSPDCRWPWASPGSAL